MNWIIFKRYYLWIVLAFVILVLSQNLEVLAEQRVIQDVTICLAIFFFAVSPINIIRYREYPRPGIQIIKGKIAILIGVFCLVPLIVAEIAMLLHIVRLLLHI